MNRVYLPRNAMRPVLTISARRLDFEAVKYRNVIYPYSLYNETFPLPHRLILADSRLRLLQFLLGYRLYFVIFITVVDISFNCLIRELDCIIFIVMRCVVT